MSGRLSRAWVIFAAAALLLLLSACGQDVGSDAGDDKITIGMSIDDLRLERWQKDRDFFIQKAEELGAEVIVQSANGDDAKQLAQIENMLSKDLDVLVIIPHSSDAMASAVNLANQEQVPVIAYDRMINNSDVDLYISYDNVRVGELQAQYLVEKVPEGNYFLLGGSPTDNNAKLFREGQMKVLKPLVDKGDIQIVGDQWAKDWQADEALKIMENALTANKNKIDAVVASNDSTAGGAVEALAAQNLAGKVAISGQDADLAACQRIVEGKQTMTVYKPIRELAFKAAEAAVRLARQEKIETTDTVNNGKKDVPALLLSPIAVDRENMMETIIKDGFHSFDDVYKNVPEAERPKRN
ncbi:xylose-binding protein [Planifilum fimeticola]|jgi:D-xylose transport system substrate-binding protein|uniref:D-xylose-binding periplasmic protein n=1 Tax=Planifilum fimeticola TaxID=201975 RepID=A0A2T0LIX9_9BACL|nr:D-xylose ABC transporter substrate-binding protein [Planifilum fimeticola]PRX42390.1 xylose-binding protein [Planifilum fimeticola]